MIDGIKNPIDLIEYDLKRVSFLCHRRFGIGADGLIILMPSEQYDFKMIYYNSDGAKSTMCGNGARCIIKFAHDLGYTKNYCAFEAVDGKHEGKVGDLISVKMIDVDKIDPYEDDFVVDTGSPHYIKFVENVELHDFLKQAKAIRHNESFDNAGINVNFVTKTEKGIRLRTFERGVEDETLSCGTGVVGASLVSASQYSELKSPISIEAEGGELEVSFSKTGSTFTNIWLTGPATKVFEGRLF